MSDQTGWSSSGKEAKASSAKGTSNLSRQRAEPLGRGALSQVESSAGEASQAKKHLLVQAVQLWDSFSSNFDLVPILNRAASAAILWPHGRPMESRAREVMRYDMGQRGTKAAELEYRVLSAIIGPAFSYPFSY